MAINKCISINILISKYISTNILWIKKDSIPFKRINSTFYYYFTCKMNNFSLGYVVFSFIYKNIFFIISLFSNIWWWLAKTNTHFNLLKTFVDLYTLLEISTSKHLLTRYFLQLSSRGNNSYENVQSSFWRISQWNTLPGRDWSVGSNEFGHSDIMCRVESNLQEVIT